MDGGLGCVWRLYIDEIAGGRELLLGGTSRDDSECEACTYCVSTLTAGLGGIAEGGGMATAEVCELLDPEPVLVLCEGATDP